MSDQPAMIRWEQTPIGEWGYLGDQYIGLISVVGPGGFLLHCILPCEHSAESHTPHTTMKSAKAFAEHRVITSLMAEAHEARNS
jgi:hypothetical protein